MCDLNLSVVGIVWTHVVRWRLRRNASSLFSGWNAASASGSLRRSSDWGACACSVCSRHPCAAPSSAHSYLVLLVLLVYLVWMGFPRMPLLGTSMSCAECPVSICWPSGSPRPPTSTAKWQIGCPWCRLGWLCSSRSWQPPSTTPTSTATPCSTPSTSPTIV